MDEYFLRAAFRKLKYLTSEIEDRQTIFSQYEKDFDRVVKIAQGNIRVQQDRERLKKNLQDAADFRESQRIQEALDNIEEDDANTPDVPQKKLYRKIAKETHPDKLDKMEISDDKKEELSEVFKRASEAYESDDVAEMISLAVSLDIDIMEAGLDPDQAYSYVKKASEKLQEKMNGMTESFVWIWGTSTGDVALRVRLLDAYLRQTGHPPVSTTLLKDIVEHHEDPSTPSSGSSKRRKRKPGERPKKLIR